jgi:hypothetical protein
MNNLSYLKVLTFSLAFIITIGFTSCEKGATGEPGPKGEIGE